MNSQENAQSPVEYFAIPTQFDGVQYRSRLEADTARVLTLLEIPFEYEPRSYLLENGAFYRPDFVLGNGDVIECRGYRTPGGDAQLAEFIRGTLERRADRPRQWFGVVAFDPSATHGHGIVAAASGMTLTTTVQDDLCPVSTRVPVVSGRWSFRRFRDAWFPVLESEWGGISVPTLSNVTRAEMSKAVDGPFLVLDIGEDGALEVVSNEGRRRVRDCKSGAELMVGGVE